jgi:hypothetical protein
MASSSDLRNMNLPGITKEVREELLSAFDAMSKWKDEVAGVNERCLAKVLVHTSAAARSLGWPDQAIKAVHDQLENASEMQTQMLDQFMDGWKQQLKSPTAPTGIPSFFTDQKPRISGGMAAGNMPAFSPLAPWTLWLQAAEMWQRTWMPEMPPNQRSRSH